jgi:hypothetical protein
MRESTPAEIIPRELNNNPVVTFRRARRRAATTDRRAALIFLVSSGAYMTYSLILRIQTDKQNNGIFETAHRTTNEIAFQGPRAIS